ncbi:MAG: flotillin-like protein FloA [Aureliella sp.]
MISQLNSMFLNSSTLLAQIELELGEGGTELTLLGILSWVGIGFLALFALFVVIAFIAFGSQWIQAFAASAKISMFSLVGMYFRQVKAPIIVQAKIMAAQAGLDISSRNGISTQRLEAHYLAGGNVMNVIQAIIAAQRAGIDLDFDRAAAIDLAGRDVQDAVRTSVHPKVIDCPDARRSGKSTLSAIAQDGVELRVRTRVTVRTNLEQLIGGATEETIIARVGESIISSIGSSDTHQTVLENPDLISRAVLSRGLDAQTAFQIVSIDIADIDVGDNIGARLRADQAEADVRVARALAEQRRAEAIATEQENRASVSENRASLLLAEAEVPRAMADAFKQGNLGVITNGS